MKTYENTSGQREFLIETTLQSGEYKGTFSRKGVGTNHGLNMLAMTDIDDMGEDEELFDNNCNFKIIDTKDPLPGCYCFECILKNDEGEEKMVSDEEDNLTDYIVKFEIVDCKILD